MAFNSVFKERHKKIHLVGIGGIGMSGIARILIESGFNVSGSDLYSSNETNTLKEMGATIFIGHNKNNIAGADVLVISSAIPVDNPELIEAQKNNIPTIKRAIMLAELMRLRCGIAVCGAHGKTTTTSLIGTLMHGANLDPTVIIGGIVNHFASNALLGKSQYMVTEADESDGTFLHLTPTIAVVTNIDKEHLDFYPGGIEEIKDKFVTFINSLPFYGLAILCSDDPHIKDIIPKINRRFVTYGFNDKADYRAENISYNGLTTKFDLCTINNIFPMQTKMPGSHNVLNTLAAIATLEEIGLCASRIKPLLMSFNGIKRRFNPISNSDNFLVIDDYAHHPTEIKAVLETARKSFPKQNIRVLFQPHRFTRTRDLMSDFASSFNNCDSLIIADIYSAQEQPIDGIDSSTLAQKVLRHSPHIQCKSSTLDDGVEFITEECQKDDIIITMGAGSITQAAPMINQLLIKKFGELNE